MGECGGSGASRGVRPVGVDDGEAFVRFTVADGCELTLSLAVRSMPGEEFDPRSVDQQRLLESSGRTFGPGERTLSVGLPSPGDDSDE